MDKIKMAEHISAMRNWLVQNAIDGVSFDLDDRYFEVCLFKWNDKKLMKTRQIFDLKDHYKIFPQEYFEDLAKEFKDNIYKKTEEE